MGAVALALRARAFVREEGLMGRFVAGEAPALDNALGEALSEIGREIDGMRIP